MKIGKRLSHKSVKKMAAVQQETLTKRADAYVDGDVTFVDINQCVAGAHARAIKPGGIIVLRESIVASGYSRVNTQKETK